MTRSTPQHDATADADPQSVARSIVLRRLTLAPRTRGELAKTLADRGVPDDAATAVLDRYTELGLVDDAELATTFAENRRTREGWSRRAIAAKLRDRGVDRDLVDEALAGMTADDEEQSALDLARRRWSRLAGLDAVTRKRRLAGVLARRGYSSDVVLSTITRVETEHAQQGVSP